MQEKHAKSLKEFAVAKGQSQGIQTQLAESQKQQWKLTACQQEAEAGWEVAEAAQEAAEAKLAAANNSITHLQEQRAAQHTQMDRLKVISFHADNCGCSCHRLPIKDYNLPSNLHGVGVGWGGIRESEGAGQESRERKGRNNMPYLQAALHQAQYHSTDCNHIAIHQYQHGIQPQIWCPKVNITPSWICSSTPAAP